MSTEMDPQAHAGAGGDPSTTGSTPQVRDDYAEDLEGAGRNGFVVPEGELRAYQKYAVKRGRNACAPEMGGGFYIGDEMGIGKTREALEIVRQQNASTILIVCPKNAVGVWEMELVKWGITSERAIYKFVGQPHSRLKTYVQFFETVGPKVLITTYSLQGQLLQTMASQRRFRREIVDFDAVIWDEIHKIRNRKTQGYKFAKQFDAPVKVGLSGSPIVNRADDMWAPLNVLQPQRYRSYWGFVDKHLVRSETDFGIEVGGLREPEKFRDEIRPIFIRRTKSQVALQLPPKQRVPIYLEMLSSQEKLYRQMWRHMYTELPDGKFVLAPSKLAQITRLRQLLVWPGLLQEDPTIAEDDNTPHPNYRSGGDWDGLHSAVLEALPEWIEPLANEERKVVIFTPFVEAFGAVERSIAPVLGKREVVWIHGGLSADQVSGSVKRFQEDPDVGAVIVSVRGATSYSLTAASHAFFVGYDWTPATNTQAEDRLHRIGQTSAVTAYYFVHNRTFDEHLLRILDGKTTWAAEALDPYKFSMVRP